MHTFTDAFLTVFGIGCAVLALWALFAAIRAAEMYADERRLWAARQLEVERKRPPFDLVTLEPVPNPEMVMVRFSRTGQAKADTLEVAVMLPAWLRRTK